MKKHKKEKKRTERAQLVAALRRMDVARRLTEWGDVEIREHAVLEKIQGKR